MGGVVLGQVVGYLLDARLQLRRRLRHRRLAARPRLRRHLPGDSGRHAPSPTAAVRSRAETCMKITRVRTRVVEWRGKTVPLAPHFCTNPMDLLAQDLIHGAQASMATFTFHGWLVVEVFTDSGHVGIGNAALSPYVTKADHRSPPDAAAPRPGSVGHRVPLAAHVPQDHGLGPQGPRHGRDQRGRHRALGRPRQGRRPAGLPPARRPDQAAHSGLCEPSATARRSTSSRPRRAATRTPAIAP